MGTCRNTRVWGGHVISALLGLLSLIFSFIFSLIFFLYFSISLSLCFFFLCCLLPHNGQETIDWRYFFISQLLLSSAFGRLENSGFHRSVNPFSPPLSPPPPPPSFTSFFHLLVSSLNCKGEASGEDDQRRCQQREETGQRQTGCSTGWRMGMDGHLRILHDPRHR